MKILDLVSQTTIVVNAPMKTVLDELQDVSIFVRVLGTQTEARPLLLVHGGPDWDHSYFLPYTTPLAAARKLILPDLRGCGRSTRFGDSKFYHVSLAAKDLLHLIDHFQISKADVLGFSFGGRVAIELARLAPGRVGSLVLASASLYQDFSAQLDGWAEYRARCTIQIRQAREALLRQLQIDDEERSRELAISLRHWTSIAWTLSHPIAATSSTRYAFRESGCALGVSKFSLLHRLTWVSR